MKTKHTKGEWTFGRPNRDAIHVLSGDGFICMLPTKDEDAEANARLIAAAPDLLDALDLANDVLKLMAEHHGSTYMGSLTQIQIASAIVKATGL